MNRPKEGLMRKSLIVGVALAIGLVAASPAAAKKSFQCNGTYTDVTVKSVLVPANGACHLIDSTVRGKVTALEGSYFQATGTQVRGNVKGKLAQTIFVEAHSSVGGSVRADKTVQVFLFDSKVRRDIAVKGATDQVDICGMTVRKGDIDVRNSGSDILIGDPQAVDCAGNLVKKGNVRVRTNVTDVELIVRGNRIHGNLRVSGNTGPAGKFVQGNTGGKKLVCVNNSKPIDCSGNTGWRKKKIS
jgi:hypothetical protein